MARYWNILWKTLKITPLAINLVYDSVLDPSRKKSAKIMENQKNIINFSENIFCLFNGHKYLPHK